MDQYQVATADGQTPLVMSGGHVVMQALSGQMSGGQTVQSPAGQVYWRHISLNIDEFLWIDNHNIFSI